MLHGLALQWLLLLKAQALKCRLRSCGAQALVAPWHVESSQTRDRTCVPCIGRQIPNREGRPRSNSFDLQSKVLAKELAKMESLEVKKFQPS